MSQTDAAKGSSSMKRGLVGRYLRLMSTNFLFAPANAKTPRNARAYHIRLLIDFFHLCMQRDDLGRARRAWAILAQCKEMDWGALWDMGLQVNAGSHDSFSRASVEYLRAMMFRRPENVNFN